MGFSFKWLANVEEMAKDIVGARMETAGRAAEVEAKRLVPVDTGKLQNSIHYYWSRADMRLTLVAEAPYAVMVEVGTSKMAARPYLRPALASVGRVFGTATEIQFSNVAPKYESGYKKQTSRLKRPHVLIGHRRPKNRRR